MMILHYWVFQNFPRTTYKVLAPNLHYVEVDIEGSSDLMYQISRSRQSSYDPDIKINRLTKWAVIKLETGAILDNPLTKIQTNEAFAAHLEIDINTAKETERTYSPDELQALFEELIVLGNEIVERGDIK